MPERVPGSAPEADGVAITLEVPRILSDSTGGQRELPMRAVTVESALERIRSDWPVLATLVLDEAGRVREHVLILHNGKLTRYWKSLDVPLSEGDRLQIVQAVSGG